MRSLRTSLARGIRVGVCSVSWKVAESLGGVLGFGVLVGGVRVPEGPETEPGAVVYSYWASWSSGEGGGGCCALGVGAGFLTLAGVPVLGVLYPSWKWDISGGGPQRPVEALYTGSRGGGGLAALTGVLLLWRRGVAAPGVNWGSCCGL